MAASELKEGGKAPAISGTVTGGEKVTMKDFTGKTLVFFWYPKAMTPG